MRKAILSGIATAAAITAGCGEGKAEDGGPTVQRSYQVGAFQEIEVAGPFDVQVRTGAGPSVSASGPEKLIERLEVELRGEAIVINHRKECWFENWRSRGHATLQVTVPSLRAASIAGSGDTASPAGRLAPQCRLRCQLHRALGQRRH